MAAYIVALVGDEVCRIEQVVDLMQQSRKSRSSCELDAPGTKAMHRGATSPGEQQECQEMAGLFGLSGIHSLAACCFSASAISFLNTSTAGTPGEDVRLVLFHRPMRRRVRCRVLRDAPPAQYCANSLHLWMGILSWAFVGSPSCGAVPRCPPIPLQSRRIEESPDDCC